MHVHPSIIICLLHLCLLLHLSIHQSHLYIKHSYLHFMIIWSIKDSLMIITFLNIFLNKEQKWEKNKFHWLLKIIYKCTFASWLLIGDCYLTWLRRIQQTSLKCIGFTTILPCMNFLNPLDLAIAFSNRIYRLTLKWRLLV